MGAQVIIIIYSHFFFPLFLKTQTHKSTHKYTLFLEPPAPPTPCQSRYVEHMQ